MAGERWEVSGGASDGVAARFCFCGVWWPVGFHGGGPCARAPAVIRAAAAAVLRCLVGLFWGSPAAVIACDLVGCLHEGGEGEECEEEDALAVLVEFDDVLCGVDECHV